MDESVSKVLAFGLYTPESKCPFSWARPHQRDLPPIEQERLRALLSYNLHLSSRPRFPSEIVKKRVNSQSPHFEVVKGRK